ncbi:myosin-2 heavy chain-like isoform X2 [Anthonomus grandis grandis]|nr:myosin-2 heavy chain-like isoform X2 [Anthonomus grandis grandis]
MNNIESRISNTLRDQEYLIRKIVYKLCEKIKLQDMLGFEGFLSDPYHINLFDKLLSATLTLRRQLDSFKICSERVLIVEEERNSIVEQVYSLPIEQRLNCNYLVGIQMEKAYLESEIKRISQNHETSRHRVNDLSAIEQILHNLQWEIHSSCLKSSEENCIGKLLEKINSEAHDLLELTKKQKEKYESEMARPKSLDPDKVLFLINVAFRGEQIGKNSTEEEKSLFQVIKKEVEGQKKKIKEDCEQGIKEQQKEYDNLRGKLSQIMLETSRTKLANRTLKGEIEELKLEQKRAMHRLKQENDAYKAQVEDLQAIREAYAQLVDRQPNIGQMERNFSIQISQRDARILELERAAESRQDEICALKAKMTDQSDQIAVLNRFINLTRPNSPREETNLSIIPKSSSLTSNPAPLDDQMKKTAKKGTIVKYKALSPRRYKQTRSRKKQKRIEKIFCVNQEQFDCYLSTNEEYSDGLKTEKSSRFSLEITYKNNEINDAFLELDEYEMFKDVSSESLALETRYKKCRGID